MTTTDPSTDGPAAPAPEESAVPIRLDAIAAGPGVVTGRPLAWLRVEGLAVAGAGLVVYTTTGQPWWLVPALFFVPDLSAIGYAAGPKVGAWSYNLAHSAPLPLALLAAGAGWNSGALTVAGAIGLFHLGLDRLTAYGLKYDHGFGATHLGIHGRH